MKKVSISSISDIRFGFYGKPAESGSITYLQVRQFNDDGVLTNENDEFIQANKSTQPHLLKDGDVLFVGKGNRIFSWCYTNSHQPTVASSIFFVLRPDQDEVYPGYLMAILNAPQSKATFQQIGGGTKIFSIRKSELGAFEIPLPPIQKQKQIASLTLLHQQEVKIAQNLIEQKKALYIAIISKLIK